MLAIDAVDARVSEVGWVLDYLPDLEADFLALYGVDDMLALDGPRFLRLAVRMPAYAGVMQARAQALLDAERAEDRYLAGQTASTAVTSRRGSPGSDVVEIDATPEAVAGRPELAGLIDWGGR